MVRQHVNPLSRYHQQPRALPPLAELFEDAQRPLHLDIGCARGLCLLELACQRPWGNHLGLEIRQPLVEAAEADRRAADLRNLHFLFANADVSLPAWLAALPPGRLMLVTIQFPDPWFKRKHRKRRLLRPPLLRELATALAPGGELFLQSDVQAVIAPMRQLVEASGCFGRAAGEAHPWQDANPLPVASEREIHAQRQGLPVYRLLYHRNANPVPSLEALEALERGPSGASGAEEPQG
jgi:tRNA (guanine-N7-)-methyltransferase